MNNFYTTEPTRANGASGWHSYLLSGDDATFWPILAGMAVLGFALIRAVG